MPLQLISPVFNFISKRNTKTETGSSKTTDSRKLSRRNHIGAEPSARSFQPQFNKIQSRRSPTRSQLSLNFAPSEHSYDFHCRSRAGASLDHTESIGSISRSSSHRSSVSSSPPSPISFSTIASSSPSSIGTNNPSMTTTVHRRHPPPPKPRNALSGFEEAQRTIRMINALEPNHHIPQKSSSRYNRLSSIYSSSSTSPPRRSDSLLRSPLSPVFPLPEEGTVTYPAESSAHAKPYAKDSEQFHNSSSSSTSSAHTNTAKAVDNLKARSYLLRPVVDSSSRGPSASSPTLSPASVTPSPSQRPDLPRSVDPKRHPVPSALNLLNPPNRTPILSENSVWLSSPNSPPVIDIRRSSPSPSSSPGPVTDVPLPKVTNSISARSSITKRQPSPPLPPLPCSSKTVSRSTSTESKFSNDLPLTPISPAFPPPPSPREQQRRRLKKVTRVLGENVPEALVVASGLYKKLFNGHRSSASEGPVAGALAPSSYTSSDFPGRLSLGAREPQAECYLLSSGDDGNVKARRRASVALPMFSLRSVASSFLGGTSGNQSFTAYSSTTHPAAPGVQKRRRESFSLANKAVADSMDFASPPVSATKALSMLSSLSSPSQPSTPSTSIPEFQFYVLPMPETPSSLDTPSINVIPTALSTPSTIGFSHSGHPSEHFTSSALTESSSRPISNHTTEDQEEGEIEGLTNEELLKLLPQRPDTPFFDIGITAPSNEQTTVVGEKNENMHLGAVRKERKDGWSGEWNQPNIQDVIVKLRELK